VIDVPVTACSARLFQLPTNVFIAGYARAGQQPGSRQDLEKGFIVGQMMYVSRPGSKSWIAK
jgi:hypothetical protein